MTNEFRRASHNVQTMVDALTSNITIELKETYENISFLDQNSLDLVLLDVYNYSKVPFVIIIDEWDCIMREKRKTMIV